MYIFMLRLAAKLKDLLWVVKSVCTHVDHKTLLSFRSFMLSHAVASIKHILYFIKPALLVLQLICRCIEGKAFSSWQLSFIIHLHVLVHVYAYIYTEMSLPYVAWWLQYSAPEWLFLSWHQEKNSCTVNRALIDMCKIPVKYFYANFKWTEFIVICS